jgi:membrane-associated phospholipid phosphatase
MKGKIMVPEGESSPLQIHLGNRFVVKQTFSYLSTKTLHGSRICRKLPPMRLIPHRQHSPFIILSILLILSPIVNSNVNASDGIEMAGDILQFVLPATAAGMTFIHKDLDGTIQFAESAALTMGVTYGLKYTVDAERPNGGRYSFPSGHTSISFASAEFIRKRYGWEFGIPAYAVASFVGYSRVEADQHYTRDVIAGAAIGILSSFLFTDPYQKVHVQMTGDSRSIGLKISCPW